jgi:hypothetical protein
LGNSLLSERNEKGLVKNGESKRLAGIVRSVSIVLLLLSCASGPDIIGKWREVGQTATLEFSAGGVFKAVDNQGMAVSGRYAFSKDGNLRCEIQQEGGAKEIVDLKVTLKGDELTLGPSNSEKIEHYRRVK